MPRLHPAALADQHELGAPTLQRESPAHVLAFWGTEVNRGPQRGSRQFVRDPRIEEVELGIAAFGGGL